MKKPTRSSRAGGKQGGPKSRGRPSGTGPGRTPLRARKVASTKEKAAPRAPTSPFKLLALANAIALAKRESGLEPAAKAPRLGQWEGPFCDALRLNGGYIRAACRTLRVARSTVYEHLAADPEFAKAVEEAKADAIEEAEAFNHLRGTAGTPKPVWYQGVMVGTEQEHSDACLHKYLEAKLPTVYGRRTTVQNPDGSAFTITVRRVSEERREAVSSRGKDGRTTS